MNYSGIGRVSGWGSQINSEPPTKKSSKSMLGKVEASTQMVEEARLDLEKQLAPFYQKLLQQGLARAAPYNQQWHDRLVVESGSFRGTISLFAPLQQETGSFYFELDNTSIAKLDKNSPLGELVDRIKRTVSQAGDSCKSVVIRYWKADFPGNSWSWHSDRLSTDLDREIDTMRTYTVTFASREEWGTRIVEPAEACAICEVRDNTQLAGWPSEEKQRKAEKLGKPSLLGHVYSANNTLHRGVIPSDIDRPSIKKEDYRLFFLLRA